MEEKLNGERERGKKLPPGFRFEPTEEEMVFQYLSRKTFSRPLPDRLIPDINNVFTFNPRDHRGDGGHDRYFFCNNESNIGYGYGKKRSDCGFWKSCGLSKPIFCSKKVPIIGIRNCFILKRRGKIARTNWIMHQYYLALSQNDQHTPNPKGCLVRIGNWSLCHIFLKHRVSSATRVDHEDDNIRVCDYLSDSYSSSASSSSESADIFADVSST